MEINEDKAVINNISVSRHPTDRSFFPKNPHIFKSGGRKNYRKSNYQNPLFCRYVILTHGISKMASTNKPGHEPFMLSQRIFLLYKHKVMRELARRRLSLGKRGVNRVNKKIRKKHFSRLFLLPTDRLTQFFKLKLRETKMLLMTA